MTEGQLHKPQISVVVLDLLVQPNAIMSPVSVARTKFSLESSPSLHKPDIPRAPTEITSALNPAEVAIVVGEDIVETNARKAKLPVDTSTFGNEVVIAV